jgi:Tol biopolymer transport system component
MGRLVRRFATLFLLLLLVGGCDYRGSGDYSDSALKWSDENPAWSPNGHEIAFDSNRANPKQPLNAVYVMKADGSGVRQLTRLGDDAELPSWSPDGRRIAYVSNLIGTDDTYTDAAAISTVRADGRRGTILASSGYMPEPPAWSPDGRWIAFQAGKSETGTLALKIVRPNGTGLRSVTNDASTFAWSPDGTRLVFTRSNYTGGIAVYVIQPVSGTITRLAGLSDGDDVTDISWSPDGSQIAFVAGWVSSSGDSLERGRVFVVNADGAKLRVVSSAQDFPHYTDFSTGVAWLRGTAHILLYNSNNGVYMASTRKQHRREITTAEGCPPVPSTDGKQFLFVPHTSSGNNALYVQKINGSAHQLTQAGKD